MNIHSHSSLMVITFVVAVLSNTTSKPSWTGVPVSDVFQIAIATALVGAIGLLYREMITSKNNQLSSQEKLYTAQLATQIATATSYLMEQKLQYENQLKEMKSQKESFKEIAYEAVHSLERKVNDLLKEKGEEPFKKIAAVVPEHNSPVTKEQQDAADLATLRARVTAAVDALGLPPREGGELETDLQRQEREAEAKKPEVTPVVITELGPKAIDQLLIAAKPKVP